MILRSHILKVAKLGLEHKLMYLQNTKIFQHLLLSIIVERGGE